MYVLVTAEDGQRAELVGQACYSLLVYTVFVVVNGGQTKEDVAAVLARLELVPD